jgi:hypothetical protein
LASKAVFAERSNSLAAGKESEARNFVLEARGGIEPPLKVLQTFALPLGDRASRQANDIIASEPALRATNLAESRARRVRGGPFARNKRFR